MLQLLQVLSHIFLLIVIEQIIHLLLIEVVSLLHDDISEVLSHLLHLLTDESQLMVQLSLLLKYQLAQLKDLLLDRLLLKNIGFSLVFLGLVVDGYVCQPLCFLNPLVQDVH